MTDKTPTTPSAQTRDYKDTVFLPKTAFPMKAGLPQKEPEIAARWAAQNLYAKLREEREGREKFILHDGPPYANGSIHIGHALNHILKDMVCRTQSLMGKDAPYIPGWDCHGLPIEWKVEEQYRKKKRNKDEVPPKEFRAECRAYAKEWVDVQREQLKRLGILGDWDNPYLTMDFQAEATIVSELLKFAEAGNLYRGSKPVMWSPVEKTALAEAEVEYEDITSTQIDVAFEIIEAPNCPELVGAYAVIWTTTPWTIPVNQAIAYGDGILYGLVEATNVEELAGKRFLIARQLVTEFNKRLDKQFGQTVLLQGVNLGGALDGALLGGTTARHPMHHLGGFYATPRPFLDGSSFVTTDSGTGLVHMAPDHGEDDFDLCKANGIEPQFAVDADGRYRDDWPWLGGHDERRMSVINPKFNAPDGPICSDLRAAGALLSASADYTHSYPHSWRSKAKVIYRCTPQWFVPMDKPLETGKTLRDTAMAEIDRVRFVPEKGRNRIGSMVSGRPDWVLSRQRAWGVPIALFVKKNSNEYLADKEVNARIIAAMREEGVDAWDEARKAEFLGAAYNPDDYDMVKDILDVWFDSGCTHAFVLESGRWEGVQWPADLYLEGSDQHRGWFQSSLLESCATRGRAPYNGVLTHGFTMDAKGKKMSKSLGNTIDPVKVMEQYGADIIRLWALSVDYTEDHRIGDEILKGVGDQYRKLRNTFRYMLGALDGYVGDMSDNTEIPELELYILSLLGELDGKLRAAAENYDFNAYVRLLTDFCNEDLSAFFFDIRKDRLYCDGENAPARNAYRAVLDILFHALIRYAAPVLVFTAEEVWQSRYPEDGEQGGSVHLLDWPSIPLVPDSNALIEKWTNLRIVRKMVTGRIEFMRREKEIGSGLEVNILIASDDPNDLALLKSVDFAEICIVSHVSYSEQLMPGMEASEYGRIGMVPGRSSHHKCARCWRHMEEVAEEGALCGRCDEAVAEWDAAQGEAAR